MKLKIVAATAVCCSLAAVVPASAQTVLMNDTAYIEPAPAYTYVTPGVVPTPGWGYFRGDIVPPQVTVVQPSVVAPAPYTLQSGPRYSYNSGYYGISYGAPMSCTVDAFGNRVCD